MHRRVVLAPLALVLVACDLLVACDGPAPEPEACEVFNQPGEQRVTCEGIQWVIHVPSDGCPPEGCGLIVDVHGLSMSADIQEKNTHLREKGAAQGYIVAQPTAPTGAPTASWSEDHDAPVRRFFDLMLAELPVDDDRVHMTGFSQGGFMVWRFLCHSAELFASIAPMSAATHGAKVPHAGCLPHQDPPAQEVDVLYMHGVYDALVDFERAPLQRDSVVYAFDMAEAAVLSEDDLHTRTRYTNTRGRVLDFIEHRYENPSPVLGGHCFPGSDDDGATPGALFAFNCTDEDQAFVWGDVVLEFFAKHPRH